MAIRCGSKRSVSEANPRQAPEACSRLGPSIEEKRCSANTTEARGVRLSNPPRSGSSVGLTMDGVAIGQRPRCIGLGVTLETSGDIHCAAQPRPPQLVLHLLHCFKVTPASTRDGPRAYGEPKYPSRASKHHCPSRRQLLALSELLRLRHLLTMTSPKFHEPVLRPPARCRDQARASAHMDLAASVQR